MKKNHEIRIKVSAEEKRKIENKAHKVGMTIASYLRFLALTSKISVVSGD